MKILFVVTEDWFFRSHFVALAHRARADGHEVLVAARHSGALADEDVRVVDMPFARRAFNPFALRAQARRLQQIIDAEHPDVIHAIALKSIAQTMLVNPRGAGRAFALTGRGYLALGDAPVWIAFAGEMFRRMLRRSLDQPRTVLVVENLADKAWVEGERALAKERFVLMPGAGVDAASFPVRPEPATPPVIVGVVSRLIRSKGIDTVVQAIALLRQRGVDIILRIAGDADPENPEHVSESEQTRWRETPGVELVGRITDVASFWASVNIACLPSRGGEGLPRSILEAAACGRPIVTTDAPGCADFVADVAGIVVPREDANALATALEQLAQSSELRGLFGSQGRARVEAGYTIQHAASTALAAWKRLSATP